MRSVKYLIDTDWVADYLKGKEKAVKLLDKLLPEGIAISLITYGEIYEGIYYGMNRTQHEKGFRAFVRGAEVLPLRLVDMKLFASIRGELRAKRKHTDKLVGDMDILIAAGAINRRLTLVSRNVKDFEQIYDLALYAYPQSQSEQAA
jgi:tRNA(fMet)-specific endonuclease VapC